MVQERQKEIMKNGLAAKGPIEMDWNMLKDVEEGLKDNPNDYYLWNARGILYFNEDFEKAIESFSNALSINPFGAHQYYNRGRKFLSEDRFPQALADFELATRLDPNDGWKWHFRGVGLFFLERYKDAAESFKKAIETHTKTGASMYPPEADWRWLSFVKLGDMEKAREAIDFITEDTPVERGDLMYKKRCLLFKGVTPIDVFMKNIERDYPLRYLTELYGAAKYYYHIEHNVEKAVECLKELVSCPYEHYCFAYKFAIKEYEEWKKEL